MIAEVEAEQAAALDTEEGQAARLIRLRGIGLTSATVLADEVFFRDFRNRREVAGYLGLASSPWASGQVRRDQGITKSGNPPRPMNRDRTRLVVVAASPGSLLAQWFHQRVGTARGRMRRIILVALARKLIIALWRYLSDGLIPDGAKLKP